MLSYFGRFGFALAIVVSLGAAASAQVVPHKEKAKGTVDVSEFISETEAIQEFSGTGNATHMGRYSQSGSHTVNLATGEILDGTFNSVAADGSTAYGVYAGTFKFNEDGTVTYNVTAIWLGGTGRLEGILGVAEVEAVVSGVTVGSTFKYVDSGFWVLP